MYRYLALAVLVLPTFVHADAESQLSKPFELRPAWNKALGPGYSGITATDRVVTTLYSDGVSDWVDYQNPVSIAALPGPLSIE